MTICCICSGRHHPTDCARAERFIAECRIAIADDFVAPVIDLFPAAVEEAWDWQTPGRAIRRYHRTRRDYNGVRVTRLG